MHQAHLIISGRVQGVFYRATCEEVAQSLDLCGWVRNLPTGEVEVLAQGKKEKIENLIFWCKKGPPSARVSDVKVEWQEANTTLGGFEVK